MITSPSRKTSVTIHREAFAHNVNTLKALASKASFFCPMIKANAYGHGAVDLAHILVDLKIETLGVATVEEGLELRKAGISQPDILIFGFFNKEDFADLAAHHLTPVVPSLEQLRLLLNHFPKSHSFHFQLKLDTGMHRLGLDLEQIDQVIDLIDFKKSQLSGVCSHLACAEDFFAQKSTAKSQVTRFKTVVDHLGLEESAHLYNSLGLMASALEDSLPPYGVRPGISLYGVKQEFINLPPKLRAQWDSIRLKPVMFWESEIALVRELRLGESVSYGFTWTASKDSIVGVVPCGYADGFRRAWSNVAQVLVRGKKVPVIGRVCMDYFLVDLTDVDQEERPKIGEQVVILGPQGENNIDGEQLARWAQTVSYEIFTGVSPRVKRSYV